MPEIYPIIAYGHPVLRAKNEIISPDFEDLNILINNMFHTMHNASGIGLAAPQIGKNINLFLVDISALKDQEEGHSLYKGAFINPEIVEETGSEWELEEGCLSIPGVRVDVKRKNVVRLRYYDENWNQKEEVFDRILARVIQHEYDHLLGKLHIDYPPYLSNKIQKKLKNIEEGNINVSYKMTFV